MSLSDLLTKAEVLTILQRSLDTTDFKLVSYEVVNAGENPMGFNGEHNKLKVDVAVGDEKKSMTYFIKRSPTVPTYKAYVDTTRSFYKEIGMYETMFEDFKNKNNAKWRPDCYFSRGSELIVLEDLSLAGFGMLPDRSKLDEEHVLASLEAIAIMHAASLIFEDRLNKGELKTLSPHFEHETQEAVTVGDVYSHLLFETEATDEPNHPGHDLYETMIKAQVTLVDLLSGYNEEQRAVIRSKLPAAMRRIYNLVKPDERHKNIVVHCDLWLNNLLFRRDAAGKLEVAIIDFQIARFAPPAHDVVMFLHLVQDKAFRDARQAAMLRHYHDCLAKELAAHGLDCERILPWQTFLDTCSLYYELAIITALFYFQLILCPGDISAEFLSSPELYSKVMFSDRNDLVQKCFLEDEIYRTRMTESMNELIHNFILI